MYSNKHTGSNHGTKPTAESRNITPTEFNIRKPDHDTEQEFIRSMKNSMAACLLVMDDNHFLIEWLAYHYHVLPLRHLIVAVDPRSRTNPSHILDRWRTKSANHNNNSSSDLMMNITVWWNDKDYGTDEHEWNEAKTWVSKRFAKDKPSDDLIQHRTRQRLFYYHCMQDHKRAGREYTLLTDSDEFLTVHNINSNNSILGNGLDPSITRSEPPKIAEAGSVLKLLQHERRLHPQNNITSSPCVQIPRLRFGAVESNLTRTLIFQSRSTLNSDLTPMDFNNNDNNADWNVSHFATLRWHVHANEQNYVLNRISKVIVDLSRIEWQFLQPVSSIHRPVEQYCKKRRLHIRAHQQKWLIHHYLGTWEQFSYRDDSRAANERSRLVRVVDMAECLLSF